MFYLYSWCLKMTKYKGFAQRRNACRFQDTGFCVLSCSSIWMEVQLFVSLYALKNRNTGNGENSKSCKSLTTARLWWKKSDTGSRTTPVDAW